MKTIEDLAKFKRYDFMLTGMYQRPDGRFLALEAIEEAKLAVYGKRGPE